MLQWRLSQVPILGRDAVNNALQSQPQVQAHPAAQHALTYILCTVCWVSLLLQQRQSGAPCRSLSCRVYQAGVGKGPSLCQVTGIGVLLN